MAKVSLARKKELNEPDEFITASSKAVQYMVDNKALVISIIGVFVFVVLSIAAYLFYSDITEKKAFAMFASDMNWYGESAEKKSLEEIKNRSDIFLKKYSGTVAGQLAMAKYASVYYAEGDYNGAVDLYKKLLKDVRGNAPFKNMVLSALGYSYESLNKYDQAIDAFEQIADSKNDAKKDEALFHLGILYQKIGEKGKSIDAFARIVSEFRNSVYYDVAKEKAEG